MKIPAPTQVTPTSRPESTPETARGSRRSPRLGLSPRCGLASLALAVCASAARAAPASPRQGVQPEIERIFAAIVSFLNPLLFVDVLGVPLIIVVLTAGGVYFTLRYRFVHLRLFKHSIDCIRGRFDTPEDAGEISHFRALTAALSATVGLGNIAGVAVAIAAGGPGAIFWMWLVAFFGMSLKFSCCSLAHLYRRVGRDGHVLGGPMVYLHDGIRSEYPRLAGLGSALGGLFAVLTVFASFGGGNLFQGKMTYEIVRDVLPAAGSLPGASWALGLAFAAGVGVVIIGGIRRIGEVTGRMVPAMCLSYCAICLLILGAHAAQVPGLLADIVRQAFSPDAAFGGFLAVLVQGTRRAAFSNEAGLGSAAIAHAAARTHEPIREGAVAMIGPFIDTIVVCTMTALAILLSGVFDPNAHLSWTEGAALTARAFATIHPAAEILLILAVAIFAYSTMISWSYYGERASEYLFGPRAITPYRIVYVALVAVGPVLSVGSVLDFSDMMLLSMAFPNILGMVLLAPMVRGRTDDYVGRLASGVMRPRR